MIIPHLSRYINTIYVTISHFCERCRYVLFGPWGPCRQLQGVLIAAALPWKIGWYWYGVGLREARKSFGLREVRLGNPGVQPRDARFASPRELLLRN